ncbi:LOW QUALITY PROTEIN: tetratricopeptide repeat protein 5, partial [Cyrtonyx montezumae]|uniref:LOW QUALITY PROTEIN: tetratricopeptide repeat protein 5 n=1 Tax=Cyrtonyx montezumae TaxID=9017 RepID=UPI0032DB7F84
EKVDPSASSNPDLHLNRATLLQFEGRYGAALEGIQRAAELAPDWPEPRLRTERLLDFLGRICAVLGGAVREGAGPGPEVGGAMGEGGGARLGWAGFGLRTRGRGRRRRALSPSLLGALGALGAPGAAGDAVTPLGSLRDGANSATAAMGRVLACVLPHERVPIAVGLSDCSGAVALSGAEDGPTVGALHIVHQGKTLSFAAVRVPSPLALVVNGRRPPSAAVSAPHALCSCAPESPSSER